MTTRLVKVAAWTALLAMFGAGLGSVVRAAEAKQDTQKTQQDAENLRKYDRNANGKLDPDEEAAMKADQAKAKSPAPKKG